VNFIQARLNSIAVQARAAESTCFGDNDGCQRSALQTSFGVAQDAIRVAEGRRFGSGA